MGTARRTRGTRNARRRREGVAIGAHGEDLDIGVHGETLQWGGRFAAAPDAALLAFGASLEDDLVLAGFDVATSLAHVDALEGGAIVDAKIAAALRAALGAVAVEIGQGRFAAFAREGGYEDIHGAIDARVRELAGDAGEFLHAGRSRNDQVATTLLLYVRERGRTAELRCGSVARAAIARARTALVDGTVLAATTHWQPAQPILLAFWLAAVAENFARAAGRFAAVQREAAQSCPLGSGATSGSTLPLDRAAAARALGFAHPSRNALDAIGNRDVAIDLLYAIARATAAAARVSTECIIYCTPAFGYARLDDRASTGSSLMPQKRNPDPFEHVRAQASLLNGQLAGALGAATGIALAYHGDLQEVKAQVMQGTERGLATLASFERAFEALHFDPGAMEARANDGFTVATDVADALIAAGISARRAHALVGTAVARAEREGRRALSAADLDEIARGAQLDRLDAPLDARASVGAKQTEGSTSPQAVQRALDQLEAALDRQAERSAAMNPGPYNPASNGSLR